MLVRAHHTLRFRSALAAAVALGACALLAPTLSHATTPLPAEFEGVDIKNKLGEMLDLTLPVVDHTGKQTTLGRYFREGRPVILTLNYYRCESLCSVQLNELLATIKKLAWLPGGDEYEIVTVSFDPRDDVEIAQGKRNSYLGELAKAKAEADGEATDAAALTTRAAAYGWPFLTTSPKAIRAITEQLGYVYKFDEDSGQYAHSPVTYILSPEGKIARYLYGLTVAPQDLKFGIMEASEGRVGSLGDKILLSCFAYDADGGGYHAFAWGFMRIGGGLVLLVLGLWLWRHWRRERRRRLDHGPAQTHSAGLVVGTESRP